jgi:hypothetical protein
MRIEVSAGQHANAEFSIDVSSESCAKTTSESLGQREKQALPRDLIDLGTQISVNKQ